MEYLGRLVLPILLVMLIGYLLGSISFSIVYTWLFANHQDIRNHGSGNAGTTNVLRSVGKLPAALTFVCDFMKGIVSVWIAYLILSAACRRVGAPLELVKVSQYAAGLACVMGHIFPLYFKFKGGKAVATIAGFILVMDWRVFLLAISVFILVFIFKHIISLSSIIAATTLPVFTFLILFLFEFKDSPLIRHGTMSLGLLIYVTVVSILLSMIVIIVHRPNIKRLMCGEEKPIF